MSDTNIEKIKNTISAPGQTPEVENRFKIIMSENLLAQFESLNTSEKLLKAELIEEGLLPLEQVFPDLNLRVVEYFNNNPGTLDDILYELKLKETSIENVQKGLENLL